MGGTIGTKLLPEVWLFDIKLNKFTKVVSEGTSGFKSLGNPCYKIDDNRIVAIAEDE